MILLIDNYDSFTYNLLHYMQELGAQPYLYRNDALTAKEALALNPKAIVISPGPSNPNNAGICLDLIAEAAAKKIPIFGVCLGHQAIGQYFGGKVIRANQPMHGKVSSIIHNQQDLFADIPSPFMATRYHSLILERHSLPDCLQVTAETEDSIIMGIKHKELPLYGVQFHPESIASQYGHELIANFLKLI